MFLKLRVGIPSFVPEALLEGFPAEAEVVSIDAEGDGKIEVEFLLAPWAHSQVSAVMARTRGVKVVQSFGAGIEGLLPLVPKGATLCNARNLHTVPTAEWAVTAILASLKFLPFYAGLQSQGRWVARADAPYAASHETDGPSLLPILVEELAGKTVLIVGYGAIGKAIEERLTGFEVEILRVARTAREGVSPVDALPSLLARADVVVLITPLTPETRHLMNASTIGQMKPGALLVNAARGGVVETEALVAALESRRIRAALDVTDPEPLPAGHPLWRAPGLLLTPHVAGSSPAFLTRVLAFCQAQVGRYVRGEPLENVITSSY